VKDAKQDPNLVVFNPELENVYDTPAEDLRTKLKGEYYLLLTSDKKDGSPYTVRYYDFTTQNKANWYKLGKGEFVLKCVEHDLPFYDLEADGHFNIEWQKLAAFEAIFLDRNMFTDWIKSSEIIINNKVGAYQTKVKYAKPNTDDVIYMSVFRSNRRQLSPIDENHVIPYYNFMLTYNDEEYFLNVDPAKEAGEKDSVRFTKLTTKEIEDLMDYEKQPNYKPNYKFCFPYAINERDRVDASVDEPLYIQTLDVAAGNENAPYLVIIGAGSDLVTARQVSEAVLPGTKDWSIYTIDYKDIQSDMVTAWTFLYQVVEDNEWVKLTEPVAEGEGKGIFVNAEVPGYSQYVTASGSDPVNYARVNGIAKDSELKVVFVGDTIIGEYHKRPIWYYRIIDPATGKYLTDAKDSTKAAYEFTWETVKNKYAYFGEFVKDGDANAKDGIKADKNFEQAFGLKYTDASMKDVDLQQFRVVSSANYHEKYYPSKEYRYLANVQGRYVFVDDVESAMIFSWGQNDDGKFVGIEEVNTFNIVGLQGAVNVKNAEGVVEIFTIDGRKVSSTAITSADQTIAAPAGVVIVKNGANVMRAIVK
jgi:hypothetical protein